MISIPHPATATAIFLAAMVLLALLWPAVAGGQLPLVLPLLGTALSSACLFLLGKTREALASCMRVGFHTGMFAYFLSYPILMPDEIDFAIAKHTHFIVGLTLIVTIVGFELGYWVRGPSDVLQPTSREAFVLTRTTTRRLFVCIFAGVVIWFFSVWLLASASDMTVDALLFKMRRAIDVEHDTDVTFYRYVYEILRASLFLAASSAYLVLTSARRSLMVMGFCWLILLLCAVVGFLSGSRAMFLYSIVPVTLACWIVWEKMFGGYLRWLLIMIGTACLIITWGTMSAIRDVGVLDYDVDLLQVLFENPGTHVAGAFNLYSGVAMIVDAFPDIFPYEYGKSLVALFLGWLPRSLWTKKPYTFGLYANLIQGETLEARAASLAVGLAGEGYANFGILGALCWGGFMGLACRAGDTYIYRLTECRYFQLLPALLGGVWAAMIVRGGVPEMFYMGVFIILSQILLAKYLFHEQTRVEGGNVKTSEIRRLLWHIR